MSEFSFIEKVFIWAIPVLFAITVHEVAHGWLAYQLGDSTAKSSGRITLNPVKHIDPVGTVVLPLILLFIGSIIFGWAKPVPVNWKNLRNPRRDMALVALAGPAANLLMVIIWAVMAKLLIIIAGNLALTQLLLAMCSAGIIINIVLMVLNLFPVLPLDGGRVMAAVLPVSWAKYYSRLEPFGLIIVVVLLVTLFTTGIWGKLIRPLIRLMEIFVY